MSAPTNAPSSRTNASNRLGLDYVQEASRLGPPIVPIIDVHAHIAGVEAAQLYKRVAELYGVALTWSMSPLEQVAPLREILGESIRFTAVPDYWSKDRAHAHGQGFLERIEAFHELGATMVKFWAAPRGTDYAIETGIPGLLRLDAPLRLEAMKLASSFGMTFMTHVGDPDTWFATRYTDATRYGTKRSQYEPLEALLDRFTQPWIAAHMGGWPENLPFLDGLLERHPNLNLDCSATKWMVRELSRHSRDELVDFLQRWNGRVLFGSDIVTTDDHLRPTEGATNESAAKGSSPREAFDLYASRYWALRTLFETEYDGESPIADPDLAMVDPHRFTDDDAPPLRGKALPAELRRSLYRGAAERVLGT